MSVPYVFTTDGMLDHFIDHGPPTAEDVDTAGARLGRNAYPCLVTDLHSEGLLLPEVAAVVVPAAWSAVEFPNLALQPDVWRRLFDMAGYTVEGVPAERPSSSVTL